jgi:Recombinase
VVLEPGPADEVATVRRMFAMLVHDKKSPGEIASSLNDEQIKTDLGRAWTSGSVQAVLSNEKYIGNNVFNRISVKLKKKRVANSPDMWIRAVGAFPAIIEPELFDAAQTALAIRNRHLSDNEMLTLLKELYLRRGRLTSIIIDESRDLPTSATYRRHFGSLGRAYQLVGYLPYRASAFTEINRTLRRLYADVHSEVLSNIQQLGGTVVGDGKKDLITINGEFT